MYPSFHKPSFKTKSQPVEERAVEKQVEKHPCYGCGLLGHNKVTSCFDKSKYFNLANTSYLGSTSILPYLGIPELGHQNQQKGRRHLRDNHPRERQPNTVLCVADT